MEKEVRKCRYCGTEFVAIRDNNYCCSPSCSSKYSRKSTYREIEEYDKEQFEKMRKKRPMKPKQSITEIAVAARKAGMTYGQYVAKMGL